MMKRGLLGHAQVPAAGEPDHNGPEQLEAVATLHATIRYIRTSGEVPSRTVIAHLQKFMRGKSSTRSRGTHDKKKIQAIVHAAGGLTDPRRLKKVNTPNAYLNASVALNKGGIVATPESLRTLYESDWGQAYAKELREAWSRAETRKRTRKK